MLCCYTNFGFKLCVFLKLLYQRSHFDSFRSSPKNNEMLFSRHKFIFLNDLIYIIIFLVPFHKILYSFFYGIIWVITILLSQPLYIGPGLVDITGLHRQHHSLSLLSGCLLYLFNKIEQPYRLTVPYIQELIFLILGFILYNQYDSFNDVIDISKISRQISVVKYLYRPVVQYGIRKQKHSHIRPAPWPVYRKESKTYGLYTKQMAIRIGHQFVALFSRSIKADRVIHTLVRRKRNIYRIPIYTRAAGI